MKKTYKKKGTPSPTECKTCGYDPFERPMGGLMKNRKEDRKLVKEYCERESDYRHTVKPVWKDCCGALDHYNVILKNIDKPIWKL